MQINNTNNSNNLFITKIQSRIAMQAACFKLGLKPKGAPEYLPSAFYCLNLLLRKSIMAQDSLASHPGHQEENPPVSAMPARNRGRNRAGLNL
jgi:hypothetical protein